MKEETKRWIRRFCLILFLFYVLLLFYFLFFAESYGRVGEMQQGFRYNLIPFVEIRRFWIYREQLGAKAVFANLAGNIIAFIPFGLILPLIVRRMRRGIQVVAAGFALSLLVEVVQLITKVGCFDVDDLILNTLGSLLGYLCFSLCRRLGRRMNG